MNGGSTNTGPNERHWSSDDVAVAGEDQHWLAVADFEPELEIGRLISAALLILASGAWVGGMLWYAGGAAVRLDPVALAGFIAALCIPPALLGILWLVVRRTSRRDSDRFLATSRAMRAEAQTMERAIASVQHLLAANRSELTDQVAAMLAGADAASDRLRGAGAAIDTRTQAIDASVAALATATETAEHRLTALLAALAEAQAIVVETGRVLDAATISADANLSALGTALSDITGEAHIAERAVTTATDRLAEQAAQVAGAGNNATVEVEAKLAAAATAVDALIARLAEAVAASAAHVERQGAATVATLDTHRVAIDRAGQDAAAALAERIGSIDQAVRDLAQQLGKRRNEGEALLTAFETGLAGIDARFDRLHATGIDRTQAVSASIGALINVVDTLDGSLSAGDLTARKVIASADEVLIALDAAVREMDETLPGALDRLNARLNASRHLVAQTAPDLLALATTAQDTHDAVQDIAQVVGDQCDALRTVERALVDTLDMGRGRMDTVRDSLDRTIERAAQFADDSIPKLAETLARAQTTAEQASAHIRDTLADIVPATARDLQEQGERALANAVKRSVANPVAELSKLATQAMAAAAAASDRLSLQIADLTRTTEALEVRIAAAGAEAETRDSDTLSRRVSLLIESLNSAAIDISRSLTTDVSDTAWATYLKGDRGVFTRRAVRLVDGVQARDIAQLYDGDDAFRDHVNRYIHDFEAMLRQILALRDGSPMGVTLLSSDMGKLYVVLAQAIERLRG